LKYREVKGGDDYGELAGVGHKGGSHFQQQRERFLRTSGERIVGAATSSDWSCETEASGRTGRRVEICKETNEKNKKKTSMSGDFCKKEGSAGGYWERTPLKTHLNQRADVRARLP